MNTLISYMLCNMDDMNNRNKTEKLYDIGIFLGVVVMLAISQFLKK